MSELKEYDTLKPTDGELVTVKPNGRQRSPVKNETI